MDVLLPSVAVEWIAIERFMLALVAVAVVVRDQAQNLLEHLPWDGDLGHLKGDIATVADDLRADLDQLLLQARQRPILRLALASPACAGYSYS